MIKEKDILSIDERIKSVICEENYVKIWFNYKLNHSNEVMGDGRMEFIHEDEQELINNIRNFIIQDKHVYKIV